MGENRRPRVTIIINAHNEGKDLERTVRSFQNQAGGCELSFVIIADGTVDGSTEVFHSQDEQSVLVLAKPGERLGCGKAKALGVVEAKRVFAPDVIFHNDGHNRIIVGTVADLAHECLTREPCIVTPALGPLRCDAADKCADHCGPHCNVDCLRIVDNAAVPDNCYFGGQIAPSDVDRKSGFPRVDNTIARPPERVTLTGAVNPSCFAYSVRTLERLGGWNEYPGIWGSQELGISLRAWFAAVPVFVLRDDYVCCLHRYRSWNHPKHRALAPYEIPDAHDAANRRYVLQVAFTPRTWSSVWRPWFNRMEKNEAADALLEGSIVRRQQREFAKLKKRKDAEFFRHVYGIANPAGVVMRPDARRALYCIASGIGNVLMCVPAMKALATLSGMPIDILDVDPCRKERAHDLLRRQPFIGTVTHKRGVYDLADYRYIVGSYWGVTPDFLPRGCNSANVRRGWRTHHEVEDNVQAVRDVGYDGPVPSARLHLRRASAAHMLREYVAVGVGCGGIASKKYPHWEQVCRELATRYRLVFLGGAHGAKDPDRDEEPWMRECGENRFRALPLAGTAEVIAGARLYIGIDNGLSHVAAAVRTPSLLLYGPSSERKNIPWQSAVRVLRSGCFPCEPCWDHPRKGACPSGEGGMRACMAAIAPARVVRVAREMLDEEGWACCPTGPWFLTRRQREVNAGGEVRGDAAVQGRTLDALRRADVQTVLITPDAERERDVRWLLTLYPWAHRQRDPRTVYDVVACTAKTAGDFGGVRYLIVDDKIAN